MLKSLKLEYFICSQQSTNESQQTIETQINVHPEHQQGIQRRVCNQGAGIGTRNGQPAPAHADPQVSRSRTKQGHHQGILAVNRKCTFSAAVHTEVIKRNAFEIERFVI